MKYMVMECHFSYAVVLDEEGKFLRAANRHYQVGQVVTEIIEMQEPEEPKPLAKRSANRWISCVAAIAACLALVFTPLIRTGFAPYATVYMTINPEVRLDINKEDTVIRLKGVNQDGASLIDQYPYKNKKLTLVLEELSDRAVEKGFLHDGGKITLLLEAKDEQWAVAQTEELGVRLKKHMDEKTSVIIEVKDAASEKKVLLPAAMDSKPADSAYGESDYEEERNSAEPSEPGETLPGSSDGDSPYYDAETNYEERDSESCGLDDDDLDEDASDDDSDNDDDSNEDVLDDDNSDDNASDDNDSDDNDLEESDSEESNYDDEKEKEDDSPNEQSDYDYD